MCFFLLVRNFALTNGPYGCLIDVLFSLILMGTLVFSSSNARSILERTLCSWNFTKLDIVTLLRSDCRA